MAEDESAKGESTRPTPRRSKRAPPTIDLSATEVPVERASEAVAAGSSEPPSDAPSASAREPRHGESGNDHGGVLPPAPSLRQPWFIAGAAAIGAAAAVAGIAVLNVAGVMPFNDPKSSEMLARLAGLEAKLSAPSERPAADAKALGAIDARIGKIESELSARGGIDPALATRLGTIEVAIKSVGDAATSLNGQTQELAATMRATRERVDAIAKSLGEQQSAEKAERTKLADRITALETSTRLVEQKIETPGSTASDRGVRVAILASTLKDAVERGAPFGGELGAVAPLASDAKLLAALEPFAASGVPTAPALAAELKALIPALRRAAEMPSADAGFFDRLQANANRLVRIRPAEAPSGGDPIDVMERIERAAARADIAGALADLARLPSPTRSIAAGWIVKAQARDAALGAAQEISADARKTLATPVRSP